MRLRDIVTWGLAAGWMVTLASAARAQDDSTRRVRDSLAARLAVTRVAPDCTKGAGAAARPDSLCLTRRESIDSALRHNPQLRAVEEQVSQARARRVQGNAIPDPAFSLEFSQAKGLFRGPASDKVASATITVPFLDKFRLRNRIGRADVQFNETNLNFLRQSIEAQTSQTYDSLLTALRHQRNQEEAKAQADDFLKKTEARFQAGSVPRLDVVRARVDAASAENDLIASSRDVLNARASLNRLLDRPLGAPIAASDSLEVPPALPPVAALEVAALTNRPELAGIQRQLEGARATTSLAREYWLPDLSIGLVHNYESPGPGNLFTGVSMPIPIFFWQHSKGEVAEARHRERELEAADRDLRAQIGQEVRTAHSAAATALRQAIFLRDVLLPAAREAYRIASVSYGLGGSSALDVLDARRALRDAENQYTDALAAANMSRAELERAVTKSLTSFATGGPQNE